MTWVDGDKLTPANLNYKRGDWFDARAYGATDDSATSSTAGVQAAVNAAAAYSSVSSNAVVIIPSGVSYQYADVTWPDGIAVMDFASNEPSVLSTLGGLFKFHSYGRYPSGVTVGELQVIGKHNPGVTVDSQSPDNYAGSFLWRHHSQDTVYRNLWQLVSDPDFDKDTDLQLTYWGNDDTGSTVAWRIDAVGSGSDTSLAFGWRTTTPQVDWDLREVNQLRISSRGPALAAADDVLFTMRHANSDTTRKILRLDVDTNDWKVFDAAGASTLLRIGDDGEVQIPSDNLILSSNPPAGGLSAGKAGEVAWGVSSGVTFLYVCVSTSSWMRAALNPF